MVILWTEKYGAETRILLMICLTLINTTINTVMMKSVNTFGEVSVFSFGPVISSSNSLKINTVMVY